MVLGIDVIEQLGGVTICDGTVKFDVVSAVVGVASNEHPERNKAVSLDDVHTEIVDEDFHAIFDGQCWTVKWLWKNKEPVKLKNTVSCYDKTLNGQMRVEFEKEVDRWVEEGILIPWKRKVEDGVLPLMAVNQPTKGKVRPVLDFRELNQYVSCHTGDDIIDVCSETLREWRQVGDNVAIVDLKSAYLQLRVDEELWPYQLVNYKGQTFCLTRLGFGLCSAPRIMSKILKTVLNQDAKNC